MELVSYWRGSEDPTIQKRMAAFSPGQRETSVSTVSVGHKTILETCGEESGFEP